MTFEQLATGRQQEIIEAYCNLSIEIANELGFPRIAADCFCVTKEGWSFAYDDRTLDFIRDAARRAIARDEHHTMYYVYVEHCSECSHNHNREDACKHELCLCKGINNE